MKEYEQFHLDLLCYLNEMENIISSLSKNARTVLNLIWFPFDLDPNESVIFLGMKVFASLL